MLIFLTEKISATVSVYRDHPRSCGKDGQPATQSFVVWGSPPLMRERRQQHHCFLWIRGITPTHAGKTGVVVGPANSTQDHPRSCGKDMLFMAIRAAISGSPPLVRERLLHVLKEKKTKWITPARAGKTAMARACLGVAEDHPRSCGKDLILGVRSVCSGGSPPLVRERRQNRYRRMPAHGITPARAGKTSIYRRSTRATIPKLMHYCILMATMVKFS